MEDQYGQTPEDYINDLNILSNARHIEDMLFFIPLFSMQHLKPF